MIIAEAGINHNGDIKKALKLVEAAYNVGCRIIKFQCHVIDDEMSHDAKNTIPGNASESIYSIMQKAALSEAEERCVMQYAQGLGMQYLSTPFSRAAADRLECMGVSMYKIGSGECNNTPLIKHIVSFGKPIILSTGMNGWGSIDRAVDLIGDQLYALLHCTSMYPTPYDQVRLCVLGEMRERYGNIRIGLSDHSLGIYTSLAAIAMGADVIEKHFTCYKCWPGPDNVISINPDELGDLVHGETAIHQAMTGGKEVLPAEQVTANFAYASVVTIAPVKAGETFTADNTWVKRPGTGEIPAWKYESILGHVCKYDLPTDTQLGWEYVQ